MLITAASLITAWEGRCILHGPRTQHYLIKLSEQASAVGSDPGQAFAFRVASFRSLSARWGLCKPCIATLPS
jgi:hypothetical protein